MPSLPVRSLPLTAEDWAAYDRDGFVVVSGLADARALATLNARLDALMDGTVRHGEALLMQLDPAATDVPATTAPSTAAAPAAAPPAPAGGACGGGSSSAGGSAGGSAGELAAYERAGVAVAGQSVGWKGASRASRKVGEAQAGLEVDSVFAAWMAQPALRALAARVYGGHAAVAVYRAMAMAKPAGALGGGSPLPWHQDGGDWWALDRDPLAFVWLALTPATAANGCVQVVRGSHLRGLLSARGHTLSAAAVADVCTPADIVDVELEAGQAFLCHNWVVHRSGTNTTDSPRRGLSVNYIDARTRVLDPKPPLAGPLGAPGSSFPLVWPSPFAQEAADAAAAAAAAAAASAKA